MNRYAILFFERISQQILKESYTETEKKHFQNLGIKRRNSRKQNQSTGFHSHKISYFRFKSGKIVANL